MQDDLVEDWQNQAPAKGPRAAPIQVGDEPQGPSFAKVVLWVGTGCFTFVAFISVIVGVGAYALWQIAKGQMDPGAPAEVVEFKVGDPLPEPPLQLPEPAAPATRLKRINPITSAVKEIDLTEFNSRSLAGAAYGFYQNGDFQ